MKNCTNLHGMKKNAMAKFNLKKGKSLAFVAFFLFLTLGAVAKPVAPSEPTRDSTFQVLAQYYPDASFANSASARVFWGTDLDNNFFSFESGTLPSYWVNDDIYPWVVTTPDSTLTGYEGRFCMMSGNAGIPSSTSSIEATVNFVQSGSISFLGGCYGEGTSTVWDQCKFFIDGVEQFSYGALQSWDTYSYNVTAGIHTFKWSYTKDSSADAFGDGFYVDNVTLSGVGSTRAETVLYNIYRTEYVFGPTSNEDPVLLASNVSDNQYIDDSWMNLETGNYKYGVEIVGSATTGIFWSNILYKPVVEYFDVTATANPAEGGVIRGTGTYADGQSCTLTALANTGYYFLEWKQDTTTVGEYYEPTLTFNVTQDTSFVANFQAVSYYSYFTSVPENGGTGEFIGGNGYNLHYGDQVTINAIPNEGFNFVKWTADSGGRSLVELSTSPTYTFTIDDDFLNSVLEGGYSGEGEGIEFFAHFTDTIDDCTRPSQFAVTDIGPNYATLSWNEIGTSESWYIYYMAEAQTPAPVGDTIEVTETTYTLTGLLPGTLYHVFVVPSCGVGPNGVNLSMISNTLTFSTLEACPSPQHVAVNNVTGTTATVTWLDYSDSYRVQTGLANLVLNENFDNGIPSDWDNSSDYPWIVVNGHMKSGNGGIENSLSSISVTANFPSDGTVEFDAECRGEGSGGDWGAVYDSCFFLIDDELQFVYGADSTGWNHFSFEVTAGEHTFTWAYSKDVSLDPSGDYFAVDNLFMRVGEIQWNNPFPVEDAQCTLTGLTPATSYCVKVQGICGEMSTRWSEPVFFTTEAIYTVTVNANPANAGTVTGGGEFSLNETCTLTATANPGYYFLNWTQDTVMLGDYYQTEYTFSVTEDANIVANFEQIEYYPYFTSIPVEGGTAELIGNENNGIVYYGDSVTIKATPYEGYHFVKWTVWGDDEPVDLSTDSIFTFTMDNSFMEGLYEEGGEIEFIANFELVTFEITATANPTTGGTVSVEAILYDFDNGSLQGWTNIDADNDGYTWVSSMTPAPYHSSDTDLTGTGHDSSAQFVISGSYANGIGQALYPDNYLVSPQITLGGSISFWACPQDASYPAEVFGVAVSTTGNTDADDFETIQQWTMTALPTTRSGNRAQGAWQLFTVDLSAYSGQGYVAIRHFNCTDQFVLNVDDIVIVPGGGSTSSYSFIENQVCTIKATANEGYTFTNWTKNDSVVSSNASYTFTVTEDATYVANFQINGYTITANANPTAGGTVSGGGAYNYGAICNLTASANTGYTFVNWTKNDSVVSTTPNFSFTVTEDATYVANFQINGYTITANANPTAGGTVSGGGSYNYGAICNLTASANTGYTFVNWTKNDSVVSTTPSFSFTVTESATYVANFQINSYTITANANPTAGGTVSGGNSYNYGTTCNLTASANTGYTFINWTKDGEIVGTSATYSFTVTEDATYVANFSLNSYDITASANPTVGGNVSGAGTIDYGETCNLVATENEGYTFASWTENGTVVSQSPNYSFTVTAARTLVANFTLNIYDITASANPTAGGTVSGAGSYNHFESCTLTATENEGYTFVNWTKDGLVVGNTPSITFTVNGEASYVANFQLNSYAITVSANPTAGGIVTGGGTYNHFESCTLTATERAGYTFLNWSKDGEVVSTNTTYTFTVTEAATYVANFSHNSYEITATANPEEGGSISGAGTYYYGSTCTLTATANPGYTFTRWTKNGVMVSSNPSINITVTEDAAYVANFSLNMYSITVSADPTAGGTVSGGGTYLYGNNCTVSAIPNAGYTFTNWTKDGIVVSTDDSYTFSVTQDANLIAHFSLDHYNVTVSVDPEVGGTATGGGSFTYGETCTLTATANTGYSFVNWTKNGTVVSSNASYSFTVTSDGDYVANFTVARYTITVSAQPSEGGNVHGGGTYDYGHVVTLRAFVNNGYEFVNWTKDGVVVSTNANHPIVVREDAQYVAHFRANVFEIAAKTDPESMGDIEGDGQYSYGETCTLTVTPYEEYEFVNWTLDGQIVSENATFSFVVTEAREYIAHLHHVEGVAEHGGITVSLFPNPAKNKLTIEASEPVNTLEIFTISGALVSKQNNCSDKIVINVESYATGTYMIRLTTDSAVEIRRFVKE